MTHKKIRFFSGNPNFRFRSGSASTGSGQVRFGFSLTWQFQVRSGLNNFKLFLHSTHWRPCKNSLSDFCTYALLKVLEINLLCIFTHHSKMQKMARQNTFPILLLNDAKRTLENKNENVILKKFTF